MRRGYRLALAHLAAAGLPWDEGLPCVEACPPHERALLARRFARGVSMVPSSSMGRLFDAVSSLIGVRHISAYEAQAAIELEAVAAGASAHEPGAGGYVFSLVEREGLIDIDPAPVLRAIVEDLRRRTPAPVIAARFHESVAEVVLNVVRRVSGSTAARTVGLSGGVFQNVWLLSRTVSLLEGAEFRVLTHRLVPPNDGGLSLGQAVAAGLTDGWRG